MLAFARTRFGGRLARWVFAYMSFLIPVERLRETPTLVAFYHPHPSYPVHILILPKRERASLLDLSEADADLLMDLVAVTQSLVTELALVSPGYRLIVNGGAFQDVQQLHWHLISPQAGPE